MGSPELATGNEHLAPVGRNIQLAAGSWQPVAGSTKTTVTAPKVQT